MTKPFTLCALAFPLILAAQVPQGRGFGPAIAGRGMGMLGGPRAFVTGAPYSGVQMVQNVTTLPDGNSIVRKSQVNVFRDSQGRIRTEETVAATPSGAQPRSVVTILDYVGGNRYVLDAATMTAFQSPLRTPPPLTDAALPARRGMGRSSDNPQVVKTQLAPQSINGVIASGSQHVETIPAGQIGNEKPIQISRTTWISTDLKVPVRIKSTDPRFGTTEMDLTNIQTTEPNPSLFLVPPGYTIRQGPSRGGARPSRRQ